MNERERSSFSTAAIVVTAAIGLYFLLFAVIVADELLGANVISQYAPGVKEMLRVIYWPLIQLLMLFFPQ